MASIWEVESSEVTAKTGVGNGGMLHEDQEAGQSDRNKEGERVQNEGLNHKEGSSYGVGRGFLSPP